MSMTELDQSRERFREDAEAARTTPAVTAVLTDGRGRLSAGPFTWSVDLPPAVGGTNQAPSPTAYLLGALAGCGVVFIHDTLAPEFGVEITGLSATARCTADLGGLLGLDGHDPALADLAIEITLESPSEPSRVTALRQAWEQRCPIYLALLQPKKVSVTFS